MVVGRTVSTTYHPWISITLSVFQDLIATAEVKVLEVSVTGLKFVLQDARARIGLIAATTASGCKSVLELQLWHNVDLGSIWQCSPLVEDHLVDNIDALWWEYDCGARAGRVCSGGLVAVCGVNLRVECRLDVNLP